MLNNILSLDYRTIFIIMLLLLLSLDLFFLILFGLIGIIFLGYFKKKYSKRYQRVFLPNLSPNIFTIFSKLRNIFSYIFNDQDSLDEKILKYKRLMRLSFKLAIVIYLILFVWILIFILWTNVFYS